MSSTKRDQAVSGQQQSKPFLAGVKGENQGSTPADKPITAENAIKARTARNAAALYLAPIVSIEPEKVAVCPECGHPAGTQAPPLACDFWIRTSIITAIALLVGFGVRMISSAQRILATPSPTNAPAVPQFLGEMQVLGRDGTFDSFRKSADGKDDLELSSAGMRQAMGLSTSRSLNKGRFLVA